MSWLNLNQSLNSIKGQITNFASEVLSEGISDESVDNPGTSERPLKDLEDTCHKQELEIEELKKLTTQLQSSLQAERFARKNGVKEEEASWYWDPPPPAKSPEHQPSIPAYEQQIRALQDEISSLRDQPDSQNTEELYRLIEENQNLTKSLEDLDNQHQQAMERLLTLKKELQKNFEVLKQEHEDLKASNDEFAEEIQILHKKIEEKNNIIQELTSGKTDYETIHHRYQNLEKVYSLLRENAEKFQEENQELHEEVFKLQEQVTKIEHEMEVSAKHDEMSNMVPRESYEQLLKELRDIKSRRKSDNAHLDDLNIDDNAKSVIENLKRDIRELKHKLAEASSVSESSNIKLIKPDKIMQLYNKYVNFELPVDYVGEMPSATDVVLFKLESALRTLSSFKREIDVLEHTLSEKALNTNHLQTQIEDLTSENDFLTTDIQHFEREVSEMKKKNDFLIAEIAALQNTSKLEPIIETHEDNLAKLETELADCNTMNKTFKSTIHRIERELTEVKSEKVLLKKSLDELSEKYKTMVSQFEECKTQTKALEKFENTVKQEHSEKKHSFPKEIHDLRKRLTLADTRNEKLAIDMQIKENDKVILIKEIDELKHTLGKKTAEINEIKLKKKTLEHNVQDLAGQISEVSRKNMELENHKTRLDHKVNELETKLRESTCKSQSKKENHEVLSEFKAENSYLKETLANLKRELEDISKENKDLKANQSNVTERSLALQKTVEELKTELEEYENLKTSHQVLLEKKVQLEAECMSTDNKIIKLEQSFEKIISDLEEKDSIIDSLNDVIAKDKISFINLNQNVADLQTTLAIKDQKIKEMIHNVTELTEKLNDTSKSSFRNHVELETIQRQNEEFITEIEKLQQELHTKNTTMSALEIKFEELEKQNLLYKTILEQKDKEVKSLEELVDKEKRDVLLKNDEYTKFVHDRETMATTITEMKETIQSKEKEFIELKGQRDEIEKSLEEQKRFLETATKEKAELINLVNLKHNESIQYHNEIQRLNHVILEQSNELKRLMQEKDNTLQNQTGSCPNCENLTITLKEKDQIIMSMHQNALEYEKLKSDLGQANETVKSLMEKCDYFEKTLAIQVEAVKRLTAENVQLSEQESNSSRELTRLRQHLVETEESYTQELMAAEAKLNECQSRLHLVEERAKQSTNVYTSSSIRANQEVETLRSQIKLLEKQREEDQRRLNVAELARERSQSALSNLQLVLEQFTLDKERDIAAATVKLQNKISVLNKQNGELQHDINTLSEKLEQSLAGLQAATRLGDQLETKTAQIHELKEQVRTLQTSVAAAEERYHQSISNQQDKVDKNLVKNLVVNYVTSQGQNMTNRTQVLRILSTVLDFNQTECARVGLSRVAVDSLAQEFVKFLEKESRPAAPLPNMMGLTSQTASRSATPVSRKNSGLGPQPNPYEVGHKRNPSTGSNNLLFQNMETLETTSQRSMETSSVHSDKEPRLLFASPSLDTGVSQSRNTEGAILKQVLKDM